MGVAMDSNDFRGGELVGECFTLLNKSLRLVGDPCHTCAEDCDFQGVGDFIFDSAPLQATLAFGVPQLPNGWTQYTQLMSDHLPVMAALAVETSEAKLQMEQAERDGRKKL